MPTSSRPWSTFVLLKRIPVTLCVHAHKSEYLLYRHVSEVWTDTSRYLDGHHPLYDSVRLIGSVSFVMELKIVESLI